MKTKKSNRANLENFRTIFLQIGIILALSLLLFAFEWKSNVAFEKELFSTQVYEDLGILPPITRPKAEIPEKVEPPVFELETVDDNEDIEDIDLSQLITDIDEMDPINIIDFNEPTEKVEEEFVKVEFMPTFMGKDGRYFRNYVASNVKFPVSAVESGTVGTVFVSFVIDKDGFVTKVEITRSVHPVIDQAVIKVIENSPKWEPGIQDGKYVRVKYAIAIAFKLE